VVLSFIGGGNRSTRKKPITCHKSQTNFEPSAGFKLTTLIVIATDCIGNYKSNYHTVMTTTAPRISERNISGTEISAQQPSTLCDKVYMRQVSGFLQVFWFSPSIKLTTTI
jgi:hypothetical protein